MKQAKLILVVVEKKEDGKTRRESWKNWNKKEWSMIYFEKTNPNIYINVKKCNE